jgi:hypothetical protein
VSAVQPLRIGSAHVLREILSVGVRGAASVAHSAVNGVAASAVRVLNPVDRENSRQASASRVSTLSGVNGVADSERRVRKAAGHRETSLEVSVSRVSKAEASGAAGSEMRVRKAPAGHLEISLQGSASHASEAGSEVNEVAGSEMRV